MEAWMALCSTLDTPCRSNSSQSSFTEDVSGDGNSMVDLLKLIVHAPQTLIYSISARLKKSAGEAVVCDCVALIVRVVNDADIQCVPEGGVQDRNVSWNLDLGSGHERERNRSSDTACPADHPADVEARVVEIEELQHGASSTIDRLLDEPFHLG